MVQWLEVDGQPRENLEENLDGQPWTCPNACDSAQKCVKPLLAGDVMRLINQRKFRGGKRMEQEDRTVSLYLPRKGPAAGAQAHGEIQQEGPGKVHPAVLLTGVVEEGVREVCSSLMNGQASDGNCILPSWE